MYKNEISIDYSPMELQVSILVLMELCIKTKESRGITISYHGFNPCFNGTMYKNFVDLSLAEFEKQCFNPCFNGTMYKNPVNPPIYVPYPRFNPCFNGTMYKNSII